MSSLQRSRAGLRALKRVCNVLAAYDRRHPANYLCIASFISSSFASQFCSPVAWPTLSRGHWTTAPFGLYDAAELRAVDGRCSDCTTPKQAMWYFQGDLVAIPKTAQAQSTSFSQLSVAEDIRDWSHSHQAAPHVLPFMSWLGSP